jgi:hypothetical protein
VDAIAVHAGLALPGSRRADQPSRAVKVLKMVATAQPFHAVAHQTLAGLRPLLFRHMRLRFPIGYAFVMPIGTFGPYLFFRRSAEFGIG